MPHFCCIIGCGNKADKHPSLSFYRLPKIPVRHGARSELIAERRKLWLSRIYREETSNPEHWRVCGKHFITGAPAALHDRGNPDWAPVLNLGHGKYVANEPHALGSMVRYERLRKKKQRTEDLDVAQGLLQLHKQESKTDLDPLSPDFVPSLLSHTSTQEQKQRMRVMAVSERRETTKRRCLEAEYKAAAAKALTSLGVSSVEKFNNTNSTTAQGENACHYPLNKFVIDVQDPNLTIGSVTSKNVNNQSGSFVNTVLDPHLTIASVKSENVSSPSDTLGQALDTESSIAVKSENNYADDAFDSDSCITIKLENIDTPSENFANKVELENIINPSVTLVDKAQNTDSHTTKDRSTMTDMLNSYIKSLEQECQALRSKCHELEDKKHRLSLSEETFQDNDAKVKYYTGLPTFDILMDTFGFVSDYLKDQSSLTKFQQYIMTLMRFRLNHSIQGLAYRFDVSSSTVSRIFHHVIHMCATRLVPALVFWPERENTEHNLPVALKNVFPRCTAIISCLEIPIEKPSNWMIRKQTYSHHKAQNTMKYLIAVSPQGLISYVSKGWGGSHSDIHIAEHCGILDKISPGDEILADKGFNKSTRLGLYGTALTEGEKELHMIKVDKTKNMVEVQSYVEKVMGVVHAARQKYVMLQSTVSISLLKEAVYTGLTLLDKVVCVACALSNVSESVVAKS